MASLFRWVKTHKLLIFCIIAVYIAFQLLSSLLGARRHMTYPYQTSYSTPSYTSDYTQAYGTISLRSPANTAIEPQSAGYSLSLPSLGSTSESKSTARMVVQNSYMSLLVKDVKETGNTIIAYAENLGGYMVNTSYNRPQDSPFATITVRVPSSKVRQAISYYQSLAIKVTSEELQGEDITDQYTDVDARLATLKATKTKLESIMDKAVNVTDILNAQREIINLQYQIDSLVGQQKAMKQNADLTKINVYLSTDELALPYTPDRTFRPDVVFKLAVRSLFSTLQDIASVLIWLVVYSLIWAPILLGIIIYKRRKHNRNTLLSSAKENT